MSPSPFQSYLPREVKPGWKIMPLKRAFEIQLGKMLQNDAESPSDRQVPYLKANHVQWSGVETADLPTMWASSRDCRQYCICPGDLLICEGGESGRSAIVPDDIPGECMQTGSLIREQRMSLISAVVTGKIDVTKPSAEAVASCQ